MNKLVIITKREDFPVTLEGVAIVTAQEYLTSPEYIDMRQVRVFNLCRSYRYQSAGYYVSLLAEARGHRALPSVTTMQDFKSRSVTRTVSDDIDHLIQKSLAPLSGDEFDLSIYFGHNVSRRYDPLCRALNNLFEAPLLRAHFIKNRKWFLHSIGPISFKEIPPSHLSYVQEYARDYFSGRKLYTTHRSALKYSLAILTNPTEAAPPSDARALNRFARAAERAGMVPDFITRDDLAVLSQYDGLFIRATTSVADFTYRFARKAHAAGLEVIDDPLSIVRCTNKVYLAELLARYRLPCPRTLVLHRDNVHSAGETLGFPCVLKQPDSAFSAGVLKVNDHAELLALSQSLFDTSDFVVAQEFLPTDFDWRIGIVDNKPLFASKYYMAKNHWQIVNWKASTTERFGGWHTVALDEAPKAVVSTALKAANLIGNGFYGVDLKISHDKIYIIEINDNPSVDAGVEDQVCKLALYDTIMNVFASRITQRRTQEFPAESQRRG